MQTQNNFGPIVSGVMASALKKLVVNLVCRWWWCKPICGLLKMRFHLEPDYSDTNGREGYKLARPSLAKPGKGCCNAYYLHTTHSVSLHFHVRHYETDVQWVDVQNDRQFIRIKAFAFTFLIEVCVCLWSLSRYFKLKFFNNVWFIKNLTIAAVHSYLLRWVGFLWFRL